MWLNNDAGEASESKPHGAKVAHSRRREVAQPGGMEAINKMVRELRIPAASLKEAH